MLLQGAHGSRLLRSIRLSSSSRRWPWGSVRRAARCSPPRPAANQDGASRRAAARRRFRRSSRVEGSKYACVSCSNASNRSVAAARIAVPGRSTNTGPVIWCRLARQIVIQPAAFSQAPALVRALFSASTNALIRVDFPTFEIAPPWRPRGCQCEGTVRVQLPKERTGCLCA